MRVEPSVMYPASNLLAVNAAKLPPDSAAFQLPAEVLPLPENFRHSLRRPIEPLTDVSPASRIPALRVPPHLAVRDKRYSTNGTSHGFPLAM